MNNPGSTDFFESLLHKKITIPIHHKYFCPLFAQFPECSNGLLIIRQYHVVTQPDFKQVAEYIQRTRLGRDVIQKMDKLPGDIRSVLTQVQVRDEQYCHWV